MPTKMKGLLKGLRYISHIFEDKEPEMQIGLPTDVKHVAHIGWDGPSVDSPSWMDKYEAPGGGIQSGTLSISDDNSEPKWVSEDSSSRRGTRSQNSPARDQQESTKSSRRRSSADGSDSPKKEKSRSSRRHHSKDSSDSKSNRNPQSQDGSAGSESPTIDLPDIPKKSRRKKSKESVSGGSVSSRLRGTSSNTSNCSFSDYGADTGCSVRSRNNDIVKLQE